MPDSVTGSVSHVPFFPSTVAHGHFSVHAEPTHSPTQVHTESCNVYALRVSFQEASDAAVISHTPFSPEHTTQATLQSRPMKPTLHWQLDDVSLYVPCPSHS